MAPYLNPTQVSKITTDQDLSFGSYIKLFFSIYTILLNSEKSYPFPDAEKKSTHVLLCNWTTAVLSIQQLTKETLTQNTAAYTLIRTKNVKHISPVLVYLLWLPVKVELTLKYSL